MAKGRGGKEKKEPGKNGAARRIGDMASRRREQALSSRHETDVVAAACVAATLFARAAEEKFEVDPSGDFSAAGSPGSRRRSLARLDALIRDDQGGARGEARDGRDQGRRGSGGEESRGQPAGTRAAVRLTPGAQINSSTVDSRIAGGFRGWSAARFPREQAEVAVGRRGHAGLAADREPGGERSRRTRSARRG